VTTEGSAKASQAAFPIILLRVAALPANALRSFECPSALASAREVEAAFARLESRKQLRCDALYRLAPGRSALVRRLLLDWKRAVHNHRPTKWRLSDTSEVLAILEPAKGLTEEMLAWERDVERIHRGLREGQIALASDWAAVRQRFQCVWQNESLQRGILWAQPELYHELAKRLPDSQRLSKPDRRTERRELSFVAFTYRTSTKTSPFSTLTLTSVGRLANDAATFTVPDLRTCVSRLMISPHVVTRIARRWLEREDVAVKAPLATPDLLHIEPGRIAFLTHSGTNGSDGTADEVVREMSNASIGELMVCSLRETPGTHTFSSFKRAMARMLCCEEQRLEGFLKPLINARLVGPVLEYDECRPEAAESLLAAGRALDCPELCPECETLASVVERLGVVANSPLPELGRGLRAAESDIGRLLGNEAEIPPGSAVFERCAVSEPTPVPQCAVLAVIPVLEQLLNVLSLFNVDLGAAAVVQEFARERCVTGEALPVLLSFAEFWERLQSRYDGGERDAYQRAANEDPVTASATLLRRQFVHELRARMQASRANRLKLPADFVCRWTAQARDFAPRRAPLSANFLGQFATTAEAESFSFILNSVAPGYGALSAAWAVSTPANPAGVELRAYVIEALSALDRDGDVVEIAAAMDFGGQLREPLTARFLSYPNSPHSARDSGKIAWDDLGLFLDESLDCVVLGHRRDRRRVLPVHLGAISPRFFPPFYRFLLAFGPAFTPSFSVIDFVEEELSESERLAPRRYPRVEVGQVILSRETWCVPSVHLPKSMSSLLTFSEYLDLRRWARELDLPWRAFVTGAQPAEIVRGGFDLHALRKVRKPFFVDFDDYASCLLFSRYTRQAGTTVRFVEAMPWGSDNPFQDADGPRVVEVGIEVQGAPQS
jgi:hypothetical protein